MTPQALNRPVDVLAVMDEVIHDREFSETLGTLRQARAAVAELIEDRDALATALAELTAALPKGSKSLSHIAQLRRRNGEQLAWSVLNRELVDPEAYDRALAKAGAP